MYDAAVIGAGPAGSMAAWKIAEKGYKVVVVDRRKEIGLMKAMGWHTFEVLEMTAFENFLLALSGSLGAVLMALVWIKLLNRRLLQVVDRCVVKHIAVQVGADDLQDFFLE